MTIKRCGIVHLPEMGLELNMNVKTAFFSFLCLLLLPQLVNASATKGMYEVTQPVVDQQAETRIAAFQQALIEVAVRISGSSLTPTLLDLSQASRMVRQYRYQQMEQAQIDEYVKRTRSRVPPRFNLWIQLDDGKIKQMLREKGLPIWGYQRPRVLVWLAVKDGANRYILKQSDQSQIKDAVTEEAKRRGLPVVWPAYDAEEQKLLSFIDLWGQFWEPVKQASARYPVNAILIGRMAWVRGNWQVNWSLQLEDQVHNWQLTALDLSILMNSGVGVATDHISSRFAVYADNRNDAAFILRVRNLQDIGRYARATRYLSSLAPVRNIFATDVQPGYIDFQLELNGDEEDLKRIIALGNVLLPDNTPLEDQQAQQENTDSVGENNAANQTDTPGTVDKPMAPKPELPRPNVLQYRLNG